MTATTIDVLRRQLLARHPARPLVTCYDADGARTELSNVSFDNAVAKAAHLARDELGLDAGAVVALDLPLHWWTSVWFAACATLGAVVAPGAGPADADLVVCTLDDVDRALAAPEVVACRLDPWGRPFDQPLPAGVLDHAAAARGHGDRFDALPAAADPATPLLRLRDGRTLDNADVLAAADGAAAAAGLAAAGRLCTSADVGTTAGLLALLAVPVAVAGSVVLCADPGRAGDVAAAEHATAQLA